MQTPVLERAHQLARTGRYRTVTELQRALKDEGYSGFASYFAGRATRMELRSIIKAALAGRHVDASERPNA